MLVSGESCEQYQDPDSPVVMAVSRLGSTHPILDSKNVVHGDKRRAGQDFVPMVVGGEWAVAFRLLSRNEAFITNASARCRQ